MTREEAIWWVNHLFEIRKEEYFNKGMMKDAKEVEEAQCMAIEALKFVKHFDLLKEYQSLQEVVRCKDCQHANECRKIVQYARYEQNTVSMGYLPIEWCSRGKRREL